MCTSLSHWNAFSSLWTGKIILLQYDWKARANKMFPPTWKFKPAVADRLAFILKNRYELTSHGEKPNSITIINRVGGGVRHANNRRCVCIDNTHIHADTYILILYTYTRARACTCFGVVHRYRRYQHLTQKVNEIAFSNEPAANRRLSSTRDTPRPLHSCPYNA